MPVEEDWPSGLGTRLIIVIRQVQLLYLPLTLYLLNNMITVYLAQCEEMGCYPVETFYIGLNKQEAIETAQRIGREDCYSWVEEIKFPNYWEAVNYMRRENPGLVVNLPNRKEVHNSNTFWWKEF